MTNTGENENYYNNMKKSYNFIALHWIEFYENENK